MTAETKASCFVDKNTIPVIIDFWLKEEELDKFYKVYEDVPLVLVTNKEVYDYLKEHDCPLHVEHWALSYPDQYALEAIQWDKNMSSVFLEDLILFLEDVGKVCFSTS